MDRDYYSLALKAGQKQLREAAARSENPYLPALDDMLSVDRLVSGVDLGLVQIPVKYIVGTKSTGRTSSFASNFMPVAEENSEFASKWKSLCSSHLQEGIRDPVKAYEYKIDASVKPEHRTDQRRKASVHIFKSARAS